MDHIYFGKVGKYPIGRFFKRRISDFPHIKNILDECEKDTINLS